MSPSSPIGDLQDYSTVDGSDYARHRFITLIEWELLLMRRSDFCLLLTPTHKEHEYIYF